MALIVDAGPLVAMADRADPQHKVVRAFLEGTSEALFLSPFVLAEADYLVAKHLGVDGELALLADVSAGTYTLEMMGPADITRCADLVGQYRDLDIGLSDASVLLLAERYETNRILTLDERHFRAMRNPAGQSFVILPADESRRRPAGRQDP